MNPQMCQNRKAKTRSKPLSKSQVATWKTPWLSLVERRGPVSKTRDLTPSSRCGKTSVDFNQSAFFLCDVVPTKGDLESLALGPFRGSVFWGYEPQPALTLSII